MTIFVPGFMQRGEPLLGMRALDFASWTFEERIEELLDTIEPADAVVGYSMGGRIALHAALGAPDKFATLALIGVSAGVENRAERRRNDDALADWMEKSSIEEVVELWEAQPVFATQSQELRDRQRSGRLGHDPRLLATLLRSAGQGALEPVWEQLHELRCPVLLIAGEMDERYATAARRMAERIPDARVRIVPGAGHAPQLERPRLVAEILNEYLGDGGVVDRET